MRSPQTQHSRDSYTVVASLNPKSTHITLHRMYLLWLAVNFLDCFQQGMVHGWRSRHYPPIQVKPSSLAKVQWRPCKRDTLISISCSFVTREVLLIQRCFHVAAGRTSLRLSVLELPSAPPGGCVPKELT